MKKSISLLILCCAIALSASAQNDNRRWAVDFNIGSTFIKNKTDYHDAFGVDNGTCRGLGVEYYIPDSHFSTRVAYKNEVLDLVGQVVQADHSQLSVGGRWYPAPEKWMFQPRVGMNMDVLVSSDNTSHISGTNGWNNYAFDASIKSPRVAFTPSIGIDLYIFSSIAFTVDYSYSIGINSSYKAFEDTAYGPQTIAKGNLNHQNLSFGLKVTFPFHFNSDDTSHLLQSLLISFFE